jgi:hypothetical protein
VVRRSNHKEIGGRGCGCGWLKGDLDTKDPRLVDFVVGNGGRECLDLTLSIFVMKREEAAIKKFLANGGAIDNLVSGILYRGDNGNDEEEQKDEDGKNQDRLFHGIRIHDFFLFMKEEKIFFIFSFLVFVPFKFKFVKLACTTRLEDGVEVDSAIVCETKFIQLRLVGKVAKRNGVGIKFEGL